MTLSGPSFYREDLPDKRIRTLVVDDSDLLREAECSLLGSFQKLDIVATAKNGREAIDLVRLHRPDLVLMDVQMPVLNGFESASCITQEFPSVRVVHMSMHEGAALQAASQRSGARCLVSKDDLGLRLSEFIQELFASGGADQGD